MRLENGRLLSEAGDGGDERIELSGLPQRVEPSERDQHALLDTAADPLIFDQLQILVPSGALDPHEHGDLLVSPQS